MDKQAVKNLVKERVREAGKELSDSMQFLHGHNQENLDLSVDLLDGKKVVKIINATDSQYRLVPSTTGTKLTKLFLNDCKKCILHVEDSLITQHLELARCEDIEIHIKSKTITVQLDICKNVSVIYDDAMFCDDCKLIHAGVESLSVRTYEGHETTANYLELTADPLHRVADSDEVVPDQRQFITALEGNNLTTRRVIKKDGHLIPTHI